MSNKVLSLGSVASAAAGILITGGTNATPILATVTAGHRLKDDDRIIISGVTGLTAMNGTWSVKRVTDTTYQLLGSVGNGTFGGTASVASVMDTTPFLQRHRASAHIGNTPGAAVLVGTVLVEGSPDHVTYATALPSGAVAIPAASAGIGICVEVELAAYMRFRCSAYTSGGANCVLVA